MDRSVSGLMNIKGGLTVLALAVAVLAGCEGREDETVYEDYKGGGYQQSLNDKNVQSLKAALYEDPENFQLLSDLGDAYFESQRYEDAIREYEKALRIMPDNPDCLNDVGLAHFYIGNNDKAFEAVNRVIQVAPDYVHSWLSKGFMLISAGRYDEAIPPLNKVMELDPSGPLGEEAEKFLGQIAAAKGPG